MDIVDIILGIAGVLGTIGGYFAGRTKNKVDDVLALAASDPELRELFLAAAERVRELKEEAENPADE